jgi:hypothetical protein
MRGSLQWKSAVRRAAIITEQILHRCAKRGRPRGALLLCAMSATLIPWRNRRKPQQTPCLRRWRGRAASSNFLLKLLGTVRRSDLRTGDESIGTSREH